jgi:formamidopyrimidine-DNA glycosylase
MPELPEVETVVRGLRREGLVGRRIAEARVHWPRSVATPSAEEFQRRLRGRRITAIARRAKYILLTLAPGSSVIIHLRMTGRMLVTPPDAPRHPHQHVVLRLDDGREVRFQDTRKFGRWYVVSDPAAILGKLGPEPLAPAFTPPVLRALLRRHARMLKPLLLDQRVLAGLGNIYVDEALWAAGLHPRRRSDTVSAAQAARLHAAIRTVLLRGIRAKGTTLGKGSTNFYSVAGRRGRNQDGLMVFRRTGEACLRCGTVIRRLVVGQRSTHICPRCQRAPRGAR